MMTELPFPVTNTTRLVNFDMRERFKAGLGTCPSGGAGVHRWLMSQANRGVLCGAYTPHELEAVLTEAMSRPPTPVNEVSSTVEKIYREQGTNLNGIWTPGPRQKKIKRMKKDRVFTDSLPITELEGMSPVPLAETGLGRLEQFLQTLYTPEEYLYIGRQGDAGRIGGTIRRVREWAEDVRAAVGEGKGVLAESANVPQFIINPLTGTEALKKDGSGNTTLRGDGNVSVYRYILYECDVASKVRQADLLMRKAEDWNIRAIIDSGGKSLHALCRVDATDWESVKTGFFQEELGPYWADVACKNASRQSRLPGVMRNKNEQKLVWLNEYIPFSLA